MKQIRKTNPKETTVNENNLYKELMEFQMKLIINRKRDEEDEYQNKS